MDRSAGVTRILEECTDAYKEFAFERKWEYVIFQVKDDYTISVKEKWGKDKTHDDLVGKMKEVEEQDQCRFVVLNVTTKKDDIVRETIVLLSWIPDRAPVRQKMIYTSNLSLLKSTLGPSVRNVVGCTKESDLAMSNIKAQIP